MRLGDGNFGSIETLVLERHLVQIDFQTVRQFTDGHTDTTSSKIIGFFNQTGHMTIAEEPLNLALLDGIPLLHLSASRFHRLDRLHLGGTSSTTDTITASFSTQEDNQITSHRLFPDHIALRRCTDNRPQLHPFGYKAWVEVFLDIGCGQTDLISIRRVAVCRRFGNDLLWQFSWTGCSQGLGDVACTRNAHGLINIGPP